MKNDYELGIVNILKLLKCDFYLWISNIVWSLFNYAKFGNLKSNIAYKFCGKPDMTRSILSNYKGIRDISACVIVYSSDENLTACGEKGSCKAIIISLDFLSS